MVTTAAERQEFYFRNIDLLTNNSIIESVIRDIGWALIKLLVWITEACKSLYDKTFGLVDFTSWPGINKKGSGNEEFQTVELYASEKSIERSEHIKERGAKGYLIKIAECKISHLRRSMKNIEKVIKEGDRLIKEGEKTQKRLSENMQYQTETAKKKIEENMSKVYSETKKEKAKILEEQGKVNEIKTEK